MQTMFNTPERSSTRNARNHHYGNDVAGRVGLIPEFELHGYSPKSIFA